MKGFLGSFWGISLLGLLWGICVVSFPPVVPLALILAFIFPWLVSRWPEWAILGILITTSSVIYTADLPKLPIGVGSLHLVDLMLLYLVSWCIFKIIIVKELSWIPSKLNGPLFLFYGAALVSIFTAIALHHVSMNDCMREFRRINGYLLCWLIPQLIRDKEQARRLFRGLCYISALVALAMILQALVGDVFKILPGRVEVLKTFGEEEEGVRRILPPGQTLIYVIFVVLLSLQVMGHLKKLGRLGSVMLVLSGAGCLLTFNRNYYVAIVMAVLFLILKVSTRKRVHFTIWVVAGLLSLGVLLPVSGVMGFKVHHYVSSASARFQTLFSVEKVVQSQSMEWRWKENRYALQKIKEHPVLGIGLGNTYRPTFFGPSDELTKYIHNGYLYLWVKMGLLGLLSFLWLCQRFVWIGWRDWQKIEDPLWRGAFVGFHLSFLGILLSSLVNPFFMQWFSICVLGSLMGLSEVLLRLHTVNRGSS